jgi:hypothetical protein
MGMEEMVEGAAIRSRRGTRPCLMGRDCIAPTHSTVVKSDVTRQPFPSRRMTDATAALLRARVALLDSS